jgi:hypothetical protein
LKVVPEPRVTFPVTLIAAAAVADSVPDVVKFPPTAVVEPGKVIVPEPLKAR